MPERQVFKHIQPERQADFPARTRHRRKREQLLKLPGVHVGRRFGGGAAERTLAAVAGDKFASASKGVDRQVAVVAAQSADSGARLMPKVPERPGRDDGRLLKSQLARVKRRAERAHQSGDLRTNNVVSQLHLKAAQHRVV